MSNIVNSLIAIKFFISIDAIVITPEFQRMGLGRANNNLLESFRQLAPRLTYELNLRPLNKGSLLFSCEWVFL